MADEDLVAGLPQLLEDMKAFPLTLRKVLIVRALRKGAVPIERRIRDKAPDDPSTPRSSIRDNIKTNVTEQTASGARALVGPFGAGFVAGFIEFGTRHQNRNPFIGPSFDATVEEAWKIIAEDLGDGIERELKKA